LDRFLTTIFLKIEGGISMIRVDFTDVKDNQFEPLPEGTYSAEVLEVEQKMGKSSNKPYLNWQFKIDGGEHDGRRAFYMTSLSEKALWKLKQVLKNLGLDVDGQLDLDPADLVGLPCVIKIEHEEYEGEMRDRVTDVYGPDAATSDGSAGVDLYR
jgi:Protein of unknown function (DUF669)